MRFSGKPRIGVAPREKRRGEMNLELHIALELLLDLLREPAIGIKPRHLIFVLDGHELVKIAGDGFGQSLAARSDSFLPARKPFRPKAR